MRQVMRVFLFLLLLSTSVQAQGYYLYVDEDGARVFTNLGRQRDQPPAPAGAPPDAGDGHSGRYTPLIQKVAGQHGIDEELIRAVIQVESNFNPRAISSKNCAGLMQLHPDTARRFGVEDIFDPAQNIEGGVRYLRFLIDLFDRDLDRVLAAYNAGENAVARFDGIPPYRETRDYVRKVKSLYRGDLKPDQEALQRRRRQIVRLIQSDGRVLFTNTAASSY